jgi:hypothetical protein
MLPEFIVVELLGRALHPVCLVDRQQAMQAIVRRPHGLGDVIDE